MSTNRVVVIICILVFGQLLMPIMGTAMAQSGKPDLTVSSNDIVFSKDKPLKGDSVQINATVRNIGGSNASNVRVRFFDGLPADNKTISSDQILENVPVNGSAVARVNWTDTSLNGTHYIYVVVDPANTIDEDNETNNVDSRSIFVNLAPTAVITAAITSTLTLTDLTFSAENSTDPDGNITTCFWNFDDGNTSRGKSVKHAWGDDGYYNVTLLVADNDGGTDTEGISVTVYNRKPYASANDQIVNTLDTVTLDSVNSWDDDGYIAGARWTLHNGTVLVGKRVSTVYPQNGIFPVNLSVTDDDGDSNSTSLYITVNNRDPVARINASSIHINSSENITFDAYQSNDPDGYITNYTWIYPGGIKEYGIVTQHRFSTGNGSYQISLVVVDDDGAVSSAFIYIRVGNLVPVAVAGMDTIVRTYENITFDGSKSYDPDGKIMNYTWNFGDSTLSNNMMDMHYYINNGIYNATLLVADNDGATSMARINVTVLNQPPVAYYPDMTVNTFENISLNGSFCFDMDGYIANFTWDFGGGEKLFGPETVHMWTKKGIYLVLLTIRDDDGATSSCSFNVTINNALPMAAFLLYPTIPTEQQNITFNATGSSDLDGYITNFNWNFGDGSFGSGQTFEHAYATNGSYRVTLVITDNDGGTDATSQNVTVTKYDAPPVASFTFSPGSPTTTDTIEFDASASYDPSPGNIRRYEWDWGDGNTSQLFLPRTNYRFFVTGSYNVTLTVVDDAASRTFMTRTVEISQGINHPPVAVIYALQRVQESGKVLTLDGSASYDSDGTVANYTWDFGDGTQSFFSLVSHVFTLSQSIQRDFNVRLTVTDNQGASSNTSVIITITPAIPPNIRPKAILTAAPTTVFTSQLVRLSAAGSTDQDGTIATEGYSWSFGDGELGSGVEVYHRYLKPGIFVVLLTVRDDRGATGSATETIYVMNIPPVARPGSDIETQTLENVVLSGAASSDAEGEIVQYSWDFGDGTQATGPVASHVYFHSGVYEVRLTVVDDSGAASSTSINVKVRNRLPTAMSTGVNASAYAGDPLNFDGSKSSDSDGRIVNYSWDFGDGSRGEGSLAKHAFLTAGEYVVRLTVTDDSGGSSVANMTVTILKKTTTPPTKNPPAKNFIPGFQLGAVAAAMTIMIALVSRRRYRSDGL
jgi:PKD repeat protein